MRYTVETVYCNSNLELARWLDEHLNTEIVSIEHSRGTFMIAYRLYY